MTPSLSPRGLCGIANGLMLAIPLWALIILKLWWALS